MPLTVKGFFHHQDASLTDGKKAFKRIEPKKGAPVYCAFPKVTFEESLLEEYQPY